MTQLIQAAPASAAIIPRERLLHLLALMTFIIFFQAHMVAPISNATNMEGVCGKSFQTAFSYTAAVFA